MEFAADRDEPDQALLKPVVQATFDMTVGPVGGVDEAAPRGRRFRPSVGRGDDLRKHWLPMPPDPFIAAERGIPASR